MKNSLTLILLLVQSIYCYSFSSVVNKDLSNLQLLENNTSNTNNSFERHRFWVNIQNDDNHEYKETLIAFSNVSNDGIDPFDTALISTGALELFTYIDQVKYSVQSYGLPFSENKIINLGYKAVNPGMHTISLGNFDGLFTDQDIFLEDLYTGEVIDLKISNFQFDTEIGEVRQRFKIVFVNNSMSISDLSQNEKSFKVYTENDFITIQTNNIDVKQVYLYDFIGRLLYSSTNFSDNSKVVINKVFYNDLIIVNLIDDNNNIYIKKIKK